MATILREPKPRTPQASPLEKETTAAKPTRSWLQKHRMWVISLALAAVAVITVAVVGTVMMGRSGDNVSVSPSAAAAAPVAPVASAPVAPVAPEQKPAANVAQPSTSTGFASGKYKLSQITTSSSNVVVAFVAAAINQEEIPTALFPSEPHFSVPKNFAILSQELKGAEEGSWLLIGNLRLPNLFGGGFVSPGEAEQDLNLSVTAIFVLPPCTGGTGGGCIGFWPMEFRLYKTSSDDWRIRVFSVGEQKFWHREVFPAELKRAGNEPFKLLQ